MAAPIPKYWTMVTFLGTFQHHVGLIGGCSITTCLWYARIPYAPDKGELDLNRLFDRDH